MAPRSFGPRGWPFSRARIVVAAMAAPNERQTSRRVLSGCFILGFPLRRRRSSLGSNATDMPDCLEVCGPSQFLTGVCRLPNSKPKRRRRTLEAEFVARLEGFRPAVPGIAARRDLSLSRSQRARTFWRPCPDIERSISHDSRSEIHGASVEIIPLINLASVSTMPSA